MEQGNAEQVQAVKSDFGHKTFWHYLHKQRDEIEGLLEDVERRAYELLLTSQNAMWVLDQQHDLDQLEECGVFDDEPFSKIHIPPPSRTDDLGDIEDPVDVALREKREELWEKIWTRLARYCAPVASRYYGERLAVIWSCVCRAVYTDPTLMLVAQNYRFVTSIMADANLDLPTVEKLWNAIKGLYVDDVRAAVDDVLHPIRETSDYVMVFGTRVDDIVALTRYAILTGSGLAQSQIKYDFKYGGCRVLAICGFVPNNIEDFGPRYKIEKCNCLVKHNKPHWTEIRSNNTICTQDFVNACLRHPTLCAKRRHPLGLKKAPWDPTEATYFKDSILEEARPLTSLDHQLDDCFQVAIVDGGEGELEKLWYQVYEVDGFRDLLSDIGYSYLDSGELEVYEDRKQALGPLIENTELDRLAAYKRLWGRGPREGRLVDDEIEIEVIAR
ncbi:hypothetical protein BDZ97DRAFT_1905721 [Flammula alnicola]|nr:hypothetical protein BDZ97DRAFT_1905721 [Flammula alnicola]